MRRLLLLGLILQSCAAFQYSEPKENEPSAVLKFRRSYRSSAGEYLEEQLRIDGYAAYQKTWPRDAGDRPFSSSIRIDPKVHDIMLDVNFHHYETRMVTENYVDRTPYSASETYSCPSYGSKGTTYNTCTRTVTKYRETTKTRTVAKTFKIVDASCQDQIKLHPVDGRTYVFTLDFKAGNDCDFSCQLLDESNGGMELLPCS